MIRRYRVSLQSARQPVHLRRLRDMVALSMAVVPVRWCVWLACAAESCHFRAVRDFGNFAVWSVKCHYILRP